MYAAAGCTLLGSRCDVACRIGGLHLYLERRVGRKSCNTTVMFPRTVVLDEKLINDYANGLP